MHPWHDLAIRLASSPPYGDHGQWAMWAWGLTGELRYFQVAIARALETFPESPNNRNDSREDAWLLGEMAYELWLAPGTDTQRLALNSRLENWAEAILRYTDPADSDEVVGHYFGLRLIDRALGSDYCQRPGNVGAAAMRERIREFCGWAAGGEWIESSEYNLGTLQLLFCGAKLVGLDEFPEVVELMPQVREQLTWHLTPDGNDCVQWGDVQHPHSLDLHARVPLTAMVGGDVRPLIAGRQTSEYQLNLYRCLWFDLPEVSS